MSENTKRNATDEFVSVWADGMLLTDIAPTLTCGETDALVALLRAYGHERPAHMLLDEHAKNDDEGDAHYEGDKATTR